LKLELTTSGGLLFVREMSRKNRALEAATKCTPPSRKTALEALAQVWRGLKGKAMAFIRESLKRAFSKPYREQQRMDREVQVFLETLPPCHQFVLVASPELGEGEYSCGVVLSAHELLAWYRKEAEMTTIYSWDAKVRRRAMPLWLGQARANDGQVTDLPRSAFRDVRGFIADWVEAGQAHVWCYHCESWVDEVIMSKTDESHLGRLGSSWTELWYCTEGHKMHESRQEIRWIYGNRRRVS